MKLTLGLRGKSLLALLLACLVALLPTTWIGWRALAGVREHFGRAYTLNLTLLNRERILAPVARELALSKRFAALGLTHRFLMQPDDESLRREMLAEAEGFRRDFRDHAWFITDAKRGAYWYQDDSSPPSDQPRYFLHEEDAEDGWFFASMRNTETYNINVNPDKKLGTTRVWFNVIVREGQRKLGMAGTGLDLTEFLREFIRSGEVGVTPMIVDRSGAIQAHPDPGRIAYDSSTGSSSASSTLFTLLATTAERDAVRAMLQRAAANPGQVGDAWVQLDGRRQLLAAAFIPELNWHVLTAVDLAAANVMEANWFLPLALTALALVTVLLLGFGFAVDHLLLRRLHRLRTSAAEIAAGNYAVNLATKSHDELGELARSFGRMAERIQEHTDLLEQRVRDRTAALEESNRLMASAHRKIDDSIDYASLIQRAMLPDRALIEVLAGQHCVLWRPRDVVGGDFYVCRGDREHFLLGVVDCAGHGVPGALMTMLIHATLDAAVAELGPHSPAALLARTDETLRRSLLGNALPRSLATNADLGLVYVDRQTRQLRFSGARISLFWSDGVEAGELKGGRRAVNDKRSGHYDDQTLDLHPRCTWYLVTDGLLDQSGGGAGFSYGTARFLDLARSIGSLPVPAQRDRIAAALAEWQGDAAQRDDVTVLIFRLDVV